LQLNRRACTSCNGASERWTMLFVLDGVAQRRRMGVR
jgi:hypothetical protein